MPKYLILFFILSCTSLSAQSDIRNDSAKFELGVSYLKCTPGQFIRCNFSYHINTKSKLSVGCNYFINKQPSYNQGYVFVNSGYAENLLQHFGVTLQAERILVNKINLDIYAYYHIQESYLNRHQYAYFPTAYDSIGNVLYNFSTGIFKKSLFYLEQSIGINLNYKFTDHIFLKQQIGGGLFWAFGEIPGLLPSDYPFEFFLLLEAGIGFKF